MLSMQLANSQVKIRSQEDPARLRPSDVPILWADASKFQKATGWEPKIPFEQTLRDLLDYWRATVRLATPPPQAPPNSPAPSPPDTATHAHPLRPLPSA